MRKTVKKKGIRNVSTCICVTRETSICPYIPSGNARIEGWVCRRSNLASPEGHDGTFYYGDVLCTLPDIQAVYLRFHPHGSLSWQLQISYHKCLAAGAQLRQPLPPPSPDSGRDP